MSGTGSGSLNPAGERKLTPEDFEIIRLIGTGNFSEVFQVQRVLSKAEKIAVKQRQKEGKPLPTDGIVDFAMKKVNKVRLKNLGKEPEVIMEKHCLTKLNNFKPEGEENGGDNDDDQPPGRSNIIQLYWTFQDVDSLYLVMEFCPDGELWEMIVGIGMLDEVLAKFYIAQLVNAMEFIYLNGIVHRDLKAENILIDRRGVLKLIDFGTAVDVQRPDIATAGNRSRGIRGQVFKNFVGTPQFMAPEAVKNQAVGRTSDLWSLGCTIYQILAGIPAFDGPSDFLTFLLSTNLEYEFPPHFPPLAKDLVASLLQLDPDKRCASGDSDLAAVRSHSYFEGVDFSNPRRILGDRPTQPSMRESCLSHMASHWERWKEEWIKHGWMDADGCLQKDNSRNGEHVTLLGCSTDPQNERDLVAMSELGETEGESAEGRSCDGHGKGSNKGDGCQGLKLGTTANQTVGQSTNWDLPGIGVNLEVKCKELIKVKDFGHKPEERRLQERLVYLKLMKDPNGPRNQEYWDKRVKKFMEKEEKEKPTKKDEDVQELKQIETERTRSDESDGSSEKST